ncbi:hypothetical protein [Halomicrobium urmianum]|uniref:hypothetical protein n=1 Tax=Halomicrobium urmianum TaxID=1586233 RepID=UPI001CD9B447|nr:hypothetical protein [Halomicrobium urmianum]
MFGNNLLRTLALVIGVVLVVVGAGTGYGGYNQMQAAEEWSQQTHDCGSTIGDTREIECPDNPYDGGGQKVAFGLLLAVIGGVISRWGTR